MKLVRELITEDVQIITEDVNGEKNYYLSGIYLQGNLKNRNGRIYPTEILEKEVARYTTESIIKNRAYGELGHPSGPSINLDRVSHMIKELYKDGNNFIGKAKIMDTPNGRIVKSLMNEGCSLGVSSRGLGSLKQRNGINEVQEDFYLATAADIVADPSAPDAFVHGIMENKEWVCVNGNWVEQFIEEAKDDIRNTSRVNLEAKKLEIFESFLRRISNA